MKKERRETEKHHLRSGREMEESRKKEPVGQGLEEASSQALQIASRSGYSSPQSKRGEER